MLSLGVEVVSAKKPSLSIAATFIDSLDPDSIGPSNYPSCSAQILAHRTFASGQKKQLVQCLADWMGEFSIKKPFPPLIVSFPPSFFQRRTIALPFGMRSSLSSRELSRFLTEQAQTEGKPMCVEVTTACHGLREELTIHSVLFKQVWEWVELFEKSHFEVSCIECWPWSFKRLMKRFHPKVDAALVYRGAEELIICTPMSEPLTFFNLPRPSEALTSITSDPNGRLVERLSEEEVPILSSGAPWVIDEAYSQWIGSKFSPVAAQWIKNALEQEANLSLPIAMPLKQEAEYLWEIPSESMISLGAALYSAN